MNFKQIASFDNYMLANMTLGLLEENFINCHLKDEHIVTIDPLLNPAVGGIKLMVAEEQYERALQLISTAEQDYLSEKICPKCKSASLVIEEKTDTPTDFWGKLKNRVFYGQEATYSKKYRCTNCKTLYDEVPVMDAE
ncbi:MAG: DUF2007 domain-containing protein [Sphingobacteriales bacterium]|nr:MAG: DUF2007 domain-containing protein [Sphingobacteriales bacterium]